MIFDLTPALSYRGKGDKKVPLLLVGEGVRG